MQTSRLRGPVECSVPLPLGAVGAPGVGREGRPGSLPKRAALPGPRRAPGISVGSRFVPCTFGPCCPGTSQPCPRLGALGLCILLPGSHLSPSDAPSHPVISRPDKPQHRLQEPQQKLLGHECKQMKVLPASRGHWLPAGLSELCIFLSSSGTGLQAASTPKGWSGRAGGEMAVCRSSG